MNKVKSERVRWWGASLHQPVIDRRRRRRRRRRPSQKRRRRRAREKLLEKMLAAVVYLLMETVLTQSTSHSPPPPPPPPPPSLPFLPLPFPPSSHLLFHFFIFGPILKWCPSIDCRPLGISSGAKQLGWYTPPYNELVMTIMLVRLWKFLKECQLRIESW